VDDVRDDAPDLKVDVFGNGDGVEVAIGGDKEDAAVAQADAFDREFAVEDSDDNGCFGGFEGAVDNEDIACVDAGIDHGVAFDADKEGGGWVFDNEVIEV